MRALFQLFIIFGCFLSLSYAEVVTEAKPVEPFNDQSEAVPVQPIQPVMTSSEVVRKPTTRLWNLQDADILSVINEVSQETGKNFVVDPRVSGKITLISSKPIRRSEVYQVFLSVLSLLGFSAIPSGNVIKIIPNMDSGELSTRIATHQQPGKGDETVVRIIRLANISAAQLMPVLRPLLPQWSNISVYTPGNIIILVGRAANLERIYRIIQDVDKATSNEIQMITLKQASASQVAAVLNNLQAASRSAGEATPVSIAVDERTNSILLGGPKAARIKMQVLISHLDTQSSTPSGNTEVIYIRYLEAKTLAPLLSKIAQNILGKDLARYDTTSINTSGSSGSSSASSSKEPSTNFNSIQAEPNTNAVIITAPPELMRAIKSVIAKLDIRPAQVLVEAVIAEVDETNLTSLGIQWGSITPEGTVSPSTPLDFAAPGAGIVGIIPGVGIKAILSVLQNQNGVNILSTPSVVVLDNQKASIEVGQDVPEQTGSYSLPTSGGSTSNEDKGSNLFNTIGRRKVTLKLDVQPQINLGSSVKLKLKLQNDTLQNPQNPGINPLINTSNISNAVIINSEDVLVLGGLIQNSNKENINKVPILGSLPLIGPLFTQKAANQEKKNLMVFIKPIIMNTNEDALIISQYKYMATRRTQANFRDDLATIGDAPVPTRLPPWKNRMDLPSPFGKN